MSAASASIPITKIDCEHYNDFKPEEAWKKRGNWSSGTTRRNATKRGHRKVKRISRKESKWGKQGTKVEEEIKKSEKFKSSVQFKK